MNWLRSITLSAVPVHASAWRTEPAAPAGPTQPSPTCSVAVIAVMRDSEKPAGCRSTTESAVPDQSSACVDGVGSAW